MNRKLLYLVEVARDYTDALAYYEAFSSSAALGFNDAFNRAEMEVEAGWVTHQRAFGFYHRVILGKFSYHLYYRLIDTRAVIVGVLYSRFSSQRIEDTLRSRK